MKNRDTGNARICGRCTYQNTTNAKKCVLCNDVLIPLKAKDAVMSADDILVEILQLNNGFEVLYY